jgi:hypothetical protein
VHKINAKYNKERAKNGKVFGEELSPSSAPLLQLENQTLAFSEKLSIMKCFFAGRCGNAVSKRIF